MNDPGRARDTVPRAEIFLHPPAILFLEEHRHRPFQHEKYLFDRMRVRRIAFAWRHVHHRQPRRTRRNMSHLRLAESLADVAVLRATIAVVVRIAEYVPVRLDVGKAHRVALRNLFEAHVNDRGMTRMTSDLTHVWRPLVFGKGNGIF